MALKTDDEDIRDVQMFMEYGGNSDYYFQFIEYDKSGKFIKNIHMRIAMSGGNAPTEVKLAVAKLYRAMEEAGLNKHPKED